MRQESSPRPDTGAWALELIILTLIASSLALFFLPRGQSDRILKNESAAEIRVRKIAEAMSGATDGTATLSELVRRSVLAGLTAVDSVSPVHTDGAFCYCVYLVDERGRAHLEEQEKPLQADEFMVYAWPIRFGVTGRRVYAAGPELFVRYWPNGRGTFDGPTTLPPPSLAPYGSRNNPFTAHQRTGWQRTIRWLPEQP